MNTQTRLKTFHEKMTKIMHIIMTSWTLEILIRYIAFVHAHKLHLFMHISYTCSCTYLTLVHAHMLHLFMHICYTCSCTYITLVHAHIMLHLFLHICYTCSMNKNKCNMFAGTMFMQTFYTCPCTYVTLVYAHMLWIRWSHLFIWTVRNIIQIKE